MSQLNRNAAYIYDIDGITVWERLRVVRTFLTDREKSYKLALNGKKQVEVEKEKIKNNPEYSEIEKELKLERVDIENSDLDDLIDDCKNEIVFLKEIESRLAIKAEETRIEGKTDKDMYELNFFREHTERLVKKATTEVICHGRVTPDTMHYLLRNRNALNQLVSKGLVNEEVKAFVETNSNETLKIIEGANNELLGYK